MQDEPRWVPLPSFSSEASTVRYSVASPGVPGKRRLLVVLAVLSCFLGGFAVGCGGGPKVVPQTKTESHLQTLAVLYGQYMGENRGKSPPDEATFKAYIKKLPADRLMGKTVDELFVSPRDNQPYVIIYNVVMGMPGIDPPTVVAHEKTGTMGKRYVATGGGGVEEVDEARFQQLISRK